MGQLIAGCCFLLCASAVSAQPHTVHLEEMTWPEVRDAIASGTSAALYYAGSTEQNGPHMVLGKHGLIARHVAERIALRLGNTLVYPVLPYAPTGNTAARSGHMRYPGSVSISEETFGAVAREVALSAIAAGFRQVILMGDHGGGQDALARVAKNLDSEWQGKGVRVVYIADVYYRASALADKELRRLKLAQGTHADIVDTSELMYVDKSGKGLRRGRIAAGNGANGVAGDPRKASAQLGARFIEYKVISAVDQIRTLLPQR